MAILSQTVADIFVIIQAHAIWLGCVRICHFYRTLSKGYSFFVDTVYIITAWRDFHLINTAVFFNPKEDQLVAARHWLWYLGTSMCLISSHSVSE